MTASHETTAPLTIDDLRREPITISVERTGEYLGVSKAYAYQLAREGRLPTIKLGPRRIRVSTAGLLKMLGGDDT
jgi:excisionase family DNA binding protein